MAINEFIAKVVGDCGDDQGIFLVGEFDSHDAAYEAAENFVLSRQWAWCEIEIN